MVVGSGLNGNIVTVELTTTTGNQGTFDQISDTTGGSVQAFYLVNGALVGTTVNSITISYDSLQSDPTGAELPDTKESHADVWWNNILGGVQPARVQHNRFGDLPNPN